MNRREALKALGAIASSAGITVTPVTTTDAQDAAMVILKARGAITKEFAERLKAHWLQACEGTPLEGVRTVVLDDGIDLEVVKAPK